MLGRLSVSEDVHDPLGARMTVIRLDDWSGPMPRCDECERELTANEVEHGLEGFGHQGRCCDCYDIRMMGDLQTKRKGPREET